MIHRLLVVSIIFCFGDVFSQDKKTDQAHETEWVFATYTFIEFGLDRAIDPFADATEQKQIPLFPGEVATKADRLSFIQKSNKLGSEFLQSLGIDLPKGSLTVYDPLTSTLAGRVPRYIHRQIEELAVESLQTSGAIIGIYQQIIEAPSSVIREMLELVGTSFDHTVALEFLENEVKKKVKAKIVHSGIYYTRPGEPIRIENHGRSHPNSATSFDQSRQATNLFELEPILASDEQIIALNVKAIQSYAPPKKRINLLSSIKEDQPSIPATDTFTTETSFDTTVLDGNSKLYGVWQPALMTENKSGEKDVLHAGFFSPQVVRNLPEKNRVLEKWLRSYGDSIQKRQKVTPPKPPTPDPNLPIQTYTVDPDFFDNLSAKRSLENNGITFAKGATAIYQPETSTLIVHNTPDQLELVEDYFDSFRINPPSSFAATIHFVEAPANLLRQAAKESLTSFDHSKIFKRLKEAEGFAYLNTLWSEGSYGTTTQLESGTNFSYIDQSHSKPLAIIKTQRVGTVLQLEPLLGFEDNFIDLQFSLQYHYAPPTVSQKSQMTTFNKVSLSSNRTFTSGGIFMLGIWNPDAKYPSQSDRLQAAFILPVILK